MTCFCPSPPRWTVMWLLAGALFLAGKAAVAWPLRKRLGWPRTLAFAFLWVGMDPQKFLPTEQGRPAPNHRSTVGTRFASSMLATAAKILLGAGLLWCGARNFTHPMAAGWCGMIGLILLLHFGLFHALAAGWRTLGVHVEPIMDRPAAATSLAEFWGRRWNRAFRDLAHPLVYRPVARRRGHAAALWASFAASGLAHELVISVPAGGGFGLPMGYFLLQALGIAMERRIFNDVADSRVRAARAHRRLFTLAFTALPAFLLFHPPFVERVMLPFFHAIGALP